MLHNERERKRMLQSFMLKYSLDNAFRHPKNRQKEADVFTFAPYKISHLPSMIEYILTSLCILNNEKKVNVTIQSMGDVGSDPNFLNRRD